MTVNYCRTIISRDSDGQSTPLELRRKALYKQYQYVVLVKNMNYYITKIFSINDFITANNLMYVVKFHNPNI